MVESGKEAKSEKLQVGKGVKVMLKKLMLLKVMLLMQVVSGITMSQENIVDVWRSENGHFQVSYESLLNPIAINQIHSWTLKLFDAEGQPINDARVLVEGGMPVHNHGLATAPSVEAIGNGGYLLQGLRFHMMGYWELELSIIQGSIQDKAIIKLDI